VTYFATLSKPTISPFVPVVGCGTLHGPRGLIPSAHERAEEVSEAFVFSMGVDLFEGIGVAIDELAQRLMI
jgi:hypothetical protein